MELIGLSVFLWEIRMLMFSLFINFHLQKNTRDNGLMDIVILICV